MKALTILSTLIITISSCNCQKKATETTMGTSSEKTETMTSESKEAPSTQNFPVLVYESMSRGFFKKITLENNTIAVQNSRDEEPKIKTLTGEEVKAIEKAYNSIDVKEIPNLKAPTEKRFYDGAPITNLEVRMDDHIYRSTDFDGGIPPKEIENLVNTILKIADKIN
ncbi:conserved hypothetical protein [Flavobacterium sp. 9AF]|uniref:hypothetical protein n=1 Tax=Flavobacterium sp. 9AF TaxID=2653142 RepID=UPI0012EF3122|nr:hypothetical protein [Flavobacterium sp. 9AF]VXB37977.1 conserved hypothetical protein [Flavobacterium sp. 9AF]